MTTEQESGGNTVVPIPQCKNAETMTSGDGPIRPFQVPPTDPLRAGPQGVDIRIQVPSSQTANQYACVETALAPKTMGPSPHRHEHLDELAFIIEGTLSVMVEDEVYDVPAGGMHLRPRGLIHSFWNGTDEPVCFLDMFLGQNFDEYLEAFFAMREELNSSESTLTKCEFNDRVAELDREFGITQFHEQRNEILEQYELKR